MFLKICVCRLRNILYNIPICSTLCSTQVSKDYADLGQLYIHCKLGLCSNQPSKVQGNLKMVIELFLLISLVARYTRLTLQLCNGNP